MTDDDKKRAHVALQGLLGRGPTPAEVACLAATLSDVEHAERWRCKTIVGDALSVSMGHAGSGDPCSWLADVLAEIDSGKPVQVLRGDLAPATGPAQAERASIVARLRAAADRHAAKIARYQQQGRTTLQMLAAETARVLREQATEIEAEQ